MNLNKIEEGMKIILEGLEIPIDQHLKDTPKRVAKAYAEMFEGLTMNPPYLRTFEESNVDQMIISDEIDFNSFCGHHFLTFRGKAKIGYIPRNGKIVGISKLARVLDYFAKRPTVQEVLTNNIADFIYNSELNPIGVGVIIKASHDCEIIRGIKKPGSIMTTSALRGIFKENHVKQEFIEL